ncbi:hypothetical protein ACLOJK_024649 [Asimina triloba]
MVIKPRYVVNRVTAEDYDCPGKVLTFLIVLHASFRMLNLRNDFLRKKFDATLGSIQVEELDWGNPDHIRAVDPPFDYIIGTDIVYAEHLLEPLLKTIFALSGPRTTLLVEETPTLFSKRVPFINLTMMLTVVFPAGLRDPIYNLA